MPPPSLGGPLTRQVSQLEAWSQLGGVQLLEELMGFVQTKELDEASQLAALPVWISCSIFLVFFFVPELVPPDPRGLRVLGRLVPHLVPGPACGGGERAGGATPSQAGQT